MTRIARDQAEKLLDGELAPGPYYVDEDDRSSGIFGNKFGHDMLFGPQLRMKIEGQEVGETALIATTDYVERKES